MHSPPEQKIHTALILMCEIEHKHRPLPVKAAELLREILSRIRRDEPPTEGQMKYLRAAKRSKGIDATGKPQNWRGRWAL